jgi:hypothetical protein
MRPFVQAANEGQSTGCMATTAGFSFACTSFLHFVYAASVPTHILPLKTKIQEILSIAESFRFNFPCKKVAVFFVANIMPSMSEWSITWSNLKWI